MGVKLFTEFYQSDVIVASPLGLHLAMEEKRGDADFLSSLDLLLLDQADVLLMQNWDHVSQMLDSVSRPPRDDHNTDFSRVRPYFLEGQAARFRQNILLSRFMDPMISAAFNKSCHSHAGKVRFKRDEGANGSICQVALRVKQVGSQPASRHFTPSPMVAGKRASPQGHVTGRFLWVRCVCRCCCRCSTASLA